MVIFAVLVGAAALVITSVVVRHLSASDTAPAAPRRHMISGWPQVAFPSLAQLRRARALARQRSGNVSFAVIDTSGTLRCYRCHERYVAASVVKVMLLISYLNELAEDDRPLTSAHRALLEAMIRRSDNASADAIYVHVDVHGDWTTARTTAADQARLFAPINTLTTTAYRDYARRLLASVVHSQGWGIPQISRPRWLTLFKGGWRHTSGGHLVHQVARVERPGLAVAIAVLTDGNPDDGYGRRTIRGIAARLLRP